MREVLQAVVSTGYKFVDADPRETTDLVAIFDVNGDTRLGLVELAVEKLWERMSTDTDVETGVVSFSVTTRSPELSEALGQRIVELVNELNLERRQSQAAAEREFIEGQMVRAESALHTAEDSLEAFLERNWSYQNSPELTFQYDRLQRQVNLRQQVYTSLSESLEQARIDEVRNTPVITVVEPPELPARLDPRRLVLKGVLGLMLGGMLGVFWAFGREMMATSRESDADDYAEFARLRERTKEDVRGLWGLLWRKLGGT